MRLAPLLLALLVSVVAARADVTLEQFGGACGDTTDSGPAITAYRDHINANGADTLVLRPCQYFIATPPGVFGPIAPVIKGHSKSTSQLVRTFAGNSPFIRVTGAVGTTLHALALRAGPGSAGSTSDMLRIDATSTVGSGNVNISDVIINGACNQDLTVCGTIWRALFIDGFPKVTGSVGVRETSIRNLVVFSTTSGEAVRLQGVVALDWNGGFINGPGDLLVVGNATITPTYASINISHSQSSNLNLTRCVYCRFTAALWDGNVNNDSNTQYARVSGRVTGTVSPNWVNSGVSP